MYLSYRIRGVDGSCAEHSTVESYTVFICQQSYLLLFCIPSPTHSFIPGLNLSFLQILPTAALPFSLQDLLHGFPRLFTVISEHICFLLLVFSVLTLFSCRFRAVDSCWTHVGFRAHVKIASRIVSYRIVIYHLIGGSNVA